MEGIPLAGPHSSRTNGGLFNAVRARIPFRSVNLPGKPGYQRGMQRHHLLPRQLLGQRHFARLLDRIGRERIGFDDFRFNGLLLPAVEKAAVVLGLPLHRAPFAGLGALFAGLFQLPLKMDNPLRQMPCFRQARCLPEAQDARCTCDGDDKHVGDEFEHDRPQLLLWPVLP